MSASGFGRAAAWAFVLRAGWMLASYAGVVLLARWFSPTDYGRIALALSLAAFLGTVAAMGLGTGAVRFAGQYRAAGQAGLLHGFLGAAQIAVLAASTGVILLGGCAVLVGARTGWIAAPEPLFLALLLVPGFALSEVQSGMARSFGQVVAALAPRDVIWRSGLIGLGAVMSLEGWPDAVRLTGFLGCAAGLLWALVAWQALRVRAAIPTAIRTAPRMYDLAGWRRVCGPIWLTSLGIVSFRSLDVILLATVLPPEMLGRYFAASRLAALTGVVLTSVNLVAGPRIADAYHAGDRTRLQDVLRRTAVLGAVPALGLVACFALFGPGLLGLFGPGFDSVQPVLLILSLGHLVAAATGPCGLMMDLAGQERANMRIVLGAATLTILGIAVGGAAMGPVGAALATASGLALWNLTQRRYLRRQLGVETSVAAAWHRAAATGAAPGGSRHPA